MSKLYSYEYYSKSSFFAPTSTLNNDRKIIYPNPSRFMRVCDWLFKKEWVGTEESTMFDEFVTFYIAFGVGANIFIQSTFLWYSFAVLFCVKLLMLPMIYRKLRSKYWEKHGIDVPDGFETF